MKVKRLGVIIAGVILGIFGGLALAVLLEYLLQRRPRYPVALHRTEGEARSDETLGVIK